MDEQTKQKYHQLFLQSAKQYLFSFNTNLENYLRSQTEQAAVEQMFIAVHSIRSQCNVMGYRDLGNECAEVEQMLRPLRDSSTPLTSEQLNYLQDRGKKINLMLGSIAIPNTEVLVNDQQQGQESPVQNKKILLVEDDHFFQQFYAYKLKQSGFIVEEAANGDEGIKKLTTFLPNIVLLDLIMPVKDGFEFLAEKKQSESQQIVNIPVIIFSTLGQEKDIQRAKDLGANDYVNKSFFDYSTLIQKVQQFLG